MQAARQAMRQARPAPAARPAQTRLAAPEGVTSPAMTRNALAATAHHEAGHAVAAVIRRVHFRHVTIEAQDDAAGHVAYLRPARGMKQMHARGMIALAGEAAQRRFNPRSVRRHHGAGDREAVLDYAIDKSNSAREAQALVNLWQVQADNLVEMRWPVIARVATALLERRTLSYDDVQKLLIPAPPIAEAHSSSHS